MQMVFNIYIAIPIIAIIVSIIIRGRFWKFAIALGLITFFVTIALAHSANNCQSGEYCGLDAGIVSTLLPIIFGLLSLVLAVIPKPKSAPRSSK